MVEGSQIFAVTTNGEVLYTSDGGINWLNKSEGITALLWPHIIRFNNKIYVGGSQVLYESDDQGESWTEISIPVSDTKTISALGKLNGVFYLALGTNVHTSTDNLISWNQNSLENLASIPSLLAHEGSMYATTWGGRYYTSSDNGDNWILTKNQEARTMVQSLLFIESKIIMVTDEGIYQSENDGISWVENNTGFIASTITDLATNENYIFSTNFALGISRSIDNGQTWTTINNGLFNSESHKSMSQIEFYNNKLYALNTGGMFVSDDNGDNWANKFTPNPNDRVIDIDYDNGIFVVGTNDFIYISTDDGTSWNTTSKEGLLPTSYFIQVFIKDTHMVIGNTTGNIYYSNDLGQSWSDITIPASDYYINEIEMENDILYVSTNKGLFLNYGFRQNWEQFTPSDHSPINDITIQNNIIYAASDNGLQVSQLGRNRWYSANEGLKVKIRKLLVTDDQLYAGTDSKGVFKRSLTQLIIPPDDDNDGVSNEDDFCENTPKGIIVNNQGCPLIDGNAISIYTLTPTCRNAANGSIEIASTLEGYDFEINITGEGRDEGFDLVSLDQNFKINDLRSGSYEITVSISAIQYQRIFGITIHEINEISGKSLGIDFKNKTASYVLSGSKQYTVNINGTQEIFTFDTDKDNEIILTNLTSSNTITITGKNECQGIFVDSFSFDEEIIMYPTVTSGLLSLSGNLEACDVKIFNSSGQLLYEEMLAPLASLHLDGYPSGMYIVHAKTNEKTKIFKVIKK